MPLQIRAGDRIPDATVGRVVDGELRSEAISDLVAGRKAIIIGVPGAFTPVCSNVHIPDFIAGASSLKAGGFERIVCLCSDNPWTVASWAQTVDPEARLDFHSDGNLAFGKASGMLTSEPGLFLSSCLKRFTMIVDRGIVQQVRVEHSVLAVSCSSVSGLAA